jgi:hypothetical protein
MNYVRVKRAGGDLLLAHGRDPYFPGWSDTLQLNYGNPATPEAMGAELRSVAEKCDGVRCDMAMLLLPEVFERTWGIPAQPFWPEATRRVHERAPAFCFLAEVYWDLESTLLQQGFDYAYDKRLYDRLRDGHARSVREHFFAGLNYQSKLARFLENHDEARAAATFPEPRHQAAAVTTFLSPGLRFFHEGQLEGRLKRLSPHLGRAPEEPANESLRRFYSGLLEVLRRPILRHGRWQLLQCAPAWEGNGSCDAFIAFAWEDSGAERLVLAVNYAGHRSQCYVRLPGELAGRHWQFRDLLGDARWERAGSALQTTGLYLDIGPWHYHVFQMTGL